MKQPPDIFVHRTGRDHSGRQTYRLVAIEACSTQAGGTSHYAVWRSNCAICGAVFYVSAPARNPRGQVRTRTCPAHRRSSTPGSLAKAERLAARYGTAELEPLEPIRRRAGAKELT